MPNAADMVRAVETYVAAFDACDPEMVVGLFAENATVEDPVGTPPHVGHDAIRAFYTASMQGKPKLNLEGPVRIAGDTAAFAFNVGFAKPGMRVDVIDLFQFNEAGKVVSMKAFFGPTNMTGFEGMSNA
jgi:steroid delta-isomerase